MTKLQVDAFAHTNGTTAIIFATPRVEPTRLVLPNVTSSTLPAVTATVAGEIFFNNTDKKLYISNGTSYDLKSSFTQPSGTFSYGFSSSTSNATTSQSPMNIYYRRNIFQTVYTVSELTSNGAQSEAIFRNLSWNITNAVPANNSILGFTLRLFHTTQSDGSATAVPISQESKTTVYSDTSSTEFTLVETTGIKTITFAGGNNTVVTKSSTFVWNGINNICVESCTSQNQTNWTQNGTQLIVPVASGSRYYRDDAGGDACTVTPNQTETFKPSVQMVYS